MCPWMRGPGKVPPARTAERITPSGLMSLLTMVKSVTGPMAAKAPLLSPKSIAMLRNSIRDMVKKKNRRRKEGEKIKGDIGWEGTTHLPTYKHNDEEADARRPICHYVARPPAKQAGSCSGGGRCYGGWHVLGRMPLVSDSSFRQSACFRHRILSRSWVSVPMWLAYGEGRAAR